MSIKNLIDLTGQRFGRLVVIERGPNVGVQPTWYCRCDCGETSRPQGTSLRGGSARSCGCLRREESSARVTVDLTGRRFGRLVVVRQIGTKHGHSHWLCQCDCGATSKAISSNLGRGSTRSCGCLRSEMFENETGPRLAAMNSARAAQRRDELGIDGLTPDQLRTARIVENHLASGLPRESPKKRRWLVFDRDGGICHLCHLPVPDYDWHLDHIVPISRGGLDRFDNVAVAHVACNLTKAAKMLDEL